FRVVPASERTIYAHSRFYTPILPMWGRVTASRFDLLKVLRSIPALSQIGSEKGQRCPSDGSGWQAGSLFHLIDHLGEGTGLRGELREVDLLVCDDMGNEVADFIAASTSRRSIAFIHAKAFETRVERSASSLQEVST